MIHKQHNHRDGIVTHSPTCIQAHTQSAAAPSPHASQANALVATATADVTQLLSPPSHYNSHLPSSRTCFSHTRESFISVHGYHSRNQYSQIHKSFLQSAATWTSSICCDAI